MTNRDMRNSHALRRATAPAGFTLGRPSVSPTGATLWPVMMPGDRAASFTLFWPGIGGRLQLSLGDSATRPGGTASLISAPGYDELIYTRADAERLARAFIATPADDADKGRD